MSALGQKRTCAARKVMSALPPKADMCSALADVRFVPIADIALTWPLPLSGQAGGCDAAWYGLPQAARSSSAASRRRSGSRSP